MTKSMTDAEAQVVKDRADLFCEVCVFATWDQLHHRQPRRMGGTSRADVHAAYNLLAVCRSCHEDLESNRTRAYSMGWLVRQGGRPQDVPVLYRQSDVVLLDADGSLLPGVELPGDRDDRLADELEDHLMEREANE